MSIKDSLAAWLACQSINSLSMPGFLKARLCFINEMCEWIECPHNVTAGEHEEPHLELQEIND